MMLETKDLILHAGAAGDGPDLYRHLWSRAEVFHFLFSRPCANIEAGISKTAAYAEMHKEVATEFFVYERSSGQAIGIAGIKKLSPGQWTVTDIAIGPDFHGKGYGSQVLSALTRLAFVEHKADSLWYDCFEQNTASRHLALKSGFVFDHREEAEFQKNGQAVMLAYFKLDKGSYFC